MFDPTKLTPYNQASSSKPTSGGFKPSNLPTYNSQAAPSSGGGDGLLMGMAKAVVSAPATMLARPFQAVQSGVQFANSDLSLFGESDSAKKAKVLSDEAYRLSLTLKNAPEEQKAAIKERISSLNRQSRALSTKLGEDANWKETSGGIVAEAPRNFKDVKKDIGRGTGTVSLGVMGAPVAMGGMMGLGTSLEQGNDVVSMDTLTSTLVGMGLGKALDLVGKPILNAAGKAVGVVTPPMLKALTAKGAGAVSNFMASHELLGGALKPVSNKITAGAEAVDKGVDTLFKGAASIPGKVGKALYPDAGKDIAGYYEQQEMKKLLEPSTVAGPTFSKATEVAKQSQQRGIDLKKTAADNNVYISDHVSDGRFVTKDIAENIKQDAISGGSEIFRPALAEAEGGVTRVSMAELRATMARKIAEIPDSVLSTEQKKIFAEKMAREYADNSATGLRYRDGYTLTNLYDSKIQTSSGIYSTPKGGGAVSLDDTLTAKQKEIESKVFAEFLKGRAPKDLNIDAYFKAQEARFALSNYLESLDDKIAPKTLFQKGLKKISQISGATVGASTAGPFGMFSGYQFGGVMADLFAGATNPVKVSYLRSIGKTPPEIYNIMKTYTSEAEAARAITPLLPPGSSIERELMKVKNEANRIIMEQIPTPVNMIGNNITQNQRILNNTLQLPAPAPRTIVPNTGGTPNQPIAPYAPGGNLGDVGGIKPRISDKYRGQ